MKKLVFTVFAVGLGLTASIMAQVPSYVPTNGLVGWWPFNGNANDESGNGNNGSFTASSCINCGSNQVKAEPMLAIDRYNIINKSYNFSDQLDLISINNSSNLQLTNQYTISLWLYPTSFNFGKYSFGVILSKWGGGGAASYQIRISNAGNILFDTHNGTSTTTITSTNPLTLNSWSNIIITQNNTLVSIIVNDINTTNNQNMVIPMKANNTIEIGRNHNQFYNYQHEGFLGRIDDVAIWNRVLTSLEIKALYESKQENGNNQTWEEIKSPIKINPNPKGGSQNVFFDKNYTLFDQKTNEPIYPINKNGTIVYQIYYSSNEDPKPYPGEFTPEKLESHLYYKFKNYNNCKNWCDEVELNKKQNSKNNNNSSINSNPIKSSNNVAGVDESEMIKQYKCKCCNSTINGLREGVDDTGSKLNNATLNYYNSVFSDPETIKLFNVGTILGEEPVRNSYDIMRKSYYNFCSIKCTKICQE